MVVDKETDEKVIKRYLQSKTLTRLLIIHTYESQLGQGPRTMFLF